MSDVSTKSIWREGLFLAAIVAALISLWLFFEIADEVIEGEAHEFDTRILLALRDPQNSSDPIGPEWFEDAVRDITALGGITVMGLLITAVVIVLYLKRNYSTAVFILIAVIGGTLFSFTLKAGFDRPRPELVPHEVFVIFKSFPSGHAMTAAAAYLTLGFVLACTETEKRIRSFIVAFSVFITVIVGLSRIYMGVHWPTDVIAGWSLGAAWALLCWLTSRWLQYRGKLKKNQN